MNSTLEKLLKQLDLELLAPDVLRGQGAGGVRMRSFGGHVAAQTVMAAGLCTPGAAAHSLHLYFVRPGDPHAPVEFHVERVRDGSAYAARAVRAIQHGELILQAQLSFVSPKRMGLEHQVSAPDVPPPEQCPDWEEVVTSQLSDLSEELRQFMIRERPIELRPVQSFESLQTHPSATQQQFWIRAPAALPDDPLLHQALATYMSDHTLLSSVLRPHGLTFLNRGVVGASLDHAVWFHRPFRMDQWLLYTQESPIAFAGRGLAFGHYFDQQGTLVASMAQEGVIRRRKGADDA